jgi:hypothetical protein
MRIILDEYKVMTLYTTEFKIVDVLPYMFVTTSGTLQKPLCQDTLRVLLRR